MTAELTCSSVQNTLWNYLEGTIDESERAAIAMHLRECRDCNLYRSEARSMRTWSQESARQRAFLQW